MTEHTCVDGPDGCRGQVGLRWPGYGHRCYPRCERHGAEREERERANRRRYAPDGPSAPDGFDPLDADESWDEP
jgi:hypothetical protein